MKMEKVEDEKEVVKKSKVSISKPKEQVEKDALDNFFPIENLPSKCKLYPEGTEIFGRPLKVLEVKLLSSMTEENVNYIINDILKKTIITKGIELDDLLTPDKLFIIFWLRANTYKDSGYKVDFGCTKCSKPSTYSFNLEDMEVKYLKDNYDPDYEKKLPMSGTKVCFKYQTIKDEKEIERYKEKNRTNKAVEIDEDILSLAGCIESIDGDDEINLNKKYNFLVKLEPGDYVAIDTHLTNNDMGVVPVITVTCDKCGGSGPTGVTFRADFFVPKYIA